MNLHEFVNFSYKFGTNIPPGMADPRVQMVMKSQMGRMEKRVA